MYAPWCTWGMPTDSTAASPRHRESTSDTHPAFGKATLGITTANPGAVLFDSEIRHNQYVTLSIHTAERERSLGRDHLFAREKIIEIAMSKAQWADLISSFNNGSGVPVTIKHTRDQGRTPDLDFAPRLAQSQAETREAADRAFAKIKDAFAVVEDKPTKANLRALRSAIENAPANVEYAAKTLTEHVENVVTKARADVEAMVINYATQGTGELETPANVFGALSGPSENADAQGADRD